MSLILCNIIVVTMHYDFIKYQINYNSHIISHTLLLSWYFNSIFSLFCSFYKIIMKNHKLEQDYAACES